MTTDRLERIENDLETLRDILLSTARYAESANRGLDRVATHLDQTDTQVAMLAEKVDEFVFESRRTNDRQDEVLRQSSENLNQLSSRVDEFIFQAQRLFNQQAEASQQALGRIDQLAAIVERLDRNFEAQQAQTQEFQRTTNAALERIDRILDYLLRQQGNNS